MKIKMQKLKIKNLLICILFTFILCRSVFADTLYLKNGTQVKGKTVKQDAQKVVFRIGEGEDSIDVTFFSDEILRIDKQELSNFLTLPFGKDKQVTIPRPVMPQQPLAGKKKEKEPKENLESEEIEAEGGEEENPKSQEGISNESTNVLEKILELKKKAEQEDISEE